MAKVVSYMSSGRIIFKEFTIISLIFGIPVLLYDTNHKLAQMCVFISCALFIKASIAMYIKSGIGRFRPIMLMYYNQYGFVLNWKGFIHYHSSDYIIMHSMSSGHAGTAAVILVATLIFYPKCKNVAFIYTIFVLISRVLLLKHFVSDILIGATIDGVVSYWCVYCFRNMKQYISIVERCTKKGIYA